MFLLSNIPKTTHYFQNAQIPAKLYKRPLRGTQSQNGAFPAQKGRQVSIMNSTEEQTSFHIDTEDKANWLLRKLANIDVEKERIRKQYETRTAQLDTDRAELLHLYGGELEAFARRELDSTRSRRKSLTLLQGTLSFRKVNASVRLFDALEALRWAEENRQDLLHVTPTLDTTGFRELATKTLEETGELLPGMEFLPEREAFSIKT